LKGAGSKALIKLSSLWFTSRYFFQDDPSSKLTRASIGILLLYLSFGCEASIRGSKSTGECFGQAWVKNTDFFTILLANLL